MTGKERLIILADFLEKDVQPMLDGAVFDMGLWAAWNGRNVTPDLGTVSACGFAGCAIGWASLCPALVAEGLPVQHTRTDDRGMLYFSYVRLAEFFFGAPDRDRAASVFDPSEYRPEALARNEEHLYSEIPLSEVVARIRETAEAMP